MAITNSSSTSGRLVHVTETCVTRESFGRVDTHATNYIDDLCLPSEKATCSVDRTPFRLNQGRFYIETELI